MLMKYTSKKFHPRNASFSEEIKRRTVWLPSFYAAAPPPCLMILNAQLMMESTPSRLFPRMEDFYQVPELPRLPSPKRCKISLRHNLDLINTLLRDSDRLWRLYQEPCLIMLV